MTEIESGYRSPELVADNLHNTWRRWRAQRAPTDVVHLDTAAAGRSSTAVLRATAAHAEREALVGAYVAAAEALPVLETGRSQLASLLGVPAEGVAFVESGSAARQALLSAWPLQSGAVVAVLPSEWGPNLWAFDNRGLQLVELVAGANGIVDLEHLARVLANTDLAFVHLTQVASHRALVQPVAEAAALCHAAGVPLWVDAAQALGHVDAACGADAVYTTSRKWITGPRGVGMLAVTEAWWSRLTVSVSPLARGGLSDDCSSVRLLEPEEANVAGRIGLCTAAQGLLEVGPANVWRRLAEVGELTRVALSDLAGWEVVDPSRVPSAITALRPTSGQDVRQTRSRLLSEHGILTTASMPTRAPREMTQPLLRVSPHVDCSMEDLAALRSALIALNRYEH